MNESNIPHQFWRDLCEEADYPLACVSLDNKFVWVNEAFQKLVGYSATELISRTWMSITYNEDVGGDLSSVQVVIDGRIKSYSMYKQYIHKNGLLIPIELTVHRFPNSSLEPLLCFKVEANQNIQTKNEILKMREELKTLTQMVNEKKDSNINFINNNSNKDENVMGDKWQNGDKVGRNKTTNSTASIKIIIGGLVVVALSVVWLFYYVATTLNNTVPVPPPSISVSE